MDQAAWNGRSGLTQFSRFVFLLVVAAFLGWMAAPALAEESGEEEGGEAAHVPSYAQPPVEMDEVVVVDRRPLREEELIGAYRQPRWTAAPRFQTTSIYLRPPGVFEFDAWGDWTFDVENEEDPVFLQTYEIEMGISHHLQLDLYVGTEQVAKDGPMMISEQGIEMRIAFADWGVIPGNPTIYLDYLNRNNENPEGEIKLLLGGEMAPRWHWGSNLMFERELTDEEAEQEYIGTFAVSYAIVDSKFSLGLELKGMTEDEIGEAEDEEDDEGAAEEEGEDEEEEDTGWFTFNEYGFRAGPSLQWRPVPPMYLNFAALFGADVEKEDDETETVTVFNPTFTIGWEF